MSAANVKRNYKDSLFTHLFGKDPKKLVELYNAVTGSSYSPDTKVDVTTPEDVLYAGLKNDISFQLDGRNVVLTEHQSTINENMPARLLIYAARVYERILSVENLYRRKLVKIPAPEFIVLYNGQEDFPEEKQYRLSDAYLAKPEKNSMELCVRVINTISAIDRSFLSNCEEKLAARFMTEAELLERKRLSELQEEAERKEKEAAKLKSLEDELLPASASPDTLYEFWKKYKYRSCPQAKRLAADALEIVLARSGYRLTIKQIGRMMEMLSDLIERGEMNLAKAQTLFAKVRLEETKNACA